MSDLTSLQNAKEWLGVTANTDDALLQRLITAASAYLQSWLNRTFAVTAYTETRDGTGTARMMFANYPVLSVSSVMIDGAVIPASPTVGVYGYVFNATSLMLRGYRFTPGLANVVVAYSAGFATVPSEIEQATIELVALRYRERDRIGQVSKSIGGETVSFSQKDFSDAIRTVLNNYRKVVSL